QIKLVAAQYARQARAGRRPYRGAPQAKAAKNATSGQAFDEGPPRGFGVHAVYVQSIKGKLCETTSELLIQVEGTLSGIRSGPDELRPPSLETNFYGKRTQK